MDILKEKGIERPTLNDIAESLGISPQQGLDMSKYIQYCIENGYSYQNVLGGAALEASYYDSTLSSLPRLSMEDYINKTNLGEEEANRLESLQTSVNIRQTGQQIVEVGGAIIGLTGGNVDTDIADFDKVDDIAKLADDVQDVGKLNSNQNLKLHVLNNNESLNTVEGVDKFVDIYMDEIIKNSDLVWKNENITATQRGKIFEEIKARTEYKEYWNVGKTNGGTFEAVDFADSKEVIQLKTMDTNAPSYQGNKVYKKIDDYARELSNHKDIKIDSKEAIKILDITVPKGSNINKDIINDMMTDYPDVIIKIKEF